MANRFRRKLDRLTEADRLSSSDPELPGEPSALTPESELFRRKANQHLEELEILNSVAQAATSSLDLDEIVRRSIGALVGLRAFQRVSILLLDKESGDLVLHPALTDKSIFPPGEEFRIPMGKGISGWVARTGEPLCVADVRDEPRYIVGYPDTLSEVCVPLQTSGQVIGVLDVNECGTDAGDLA